MHCFITTFCVYMHEPFLVTSQDVSRYIVCNVPSRSLDNFAINIFAREIITSNGLSVFSMLSFSTCEHCPKNVLSLRIIVQMHSCFQRS